MAPFALLIIFALGCACDRWRDGLLVMPLVAFVLTALCLVTTNNPVFTSIERDLHFNVTSLGLNFLVKLAALLLSYSAGHGGRIVVNILSCRFSKQARRRRT